MWMTIVVIGSVLSGLLALWMVYDWYTVDTTYSEATLTSSREGEIEATSEKHKL
jgi:hypothetical protein